MPAPTPRRAGRQAKPGSRFLSDVVAEKIRTYRLDRRLDQEQVANHMRDHGHSTWTRSTVSQVEGGRRNVTIDELMGLSILFEIPLQKLHDPTPLEGGEPPALDIGWPVAMPPKIVRQWAQGAKVFAESETGPNGTPQVRFTAVGRLVPEEVEKS